MTDCYCTVMLFACLAALGYVYSYALTHGSPERFTHLPAGSGEVCGLTESVQNKPYLFFCQDGSGQLSYQSSICVSGCDVNGCSRGVQLAYPATPFAGLLCMPNVSALAGQMNSFISEGSPLGTILQFQGPLNAWPLVAASAAVAIISAFLFLFCLSKVTGCFIWLGFAVFVLITGGLGATLVVASQQPGSVAGLPSSGDPQQDMYVGIAASTVALVAALFGCCKRSAMQHAIDCVKAAAECIEESPSILLEPICSLIMKAVVIAVLSVCWICLLSCGKITAGSTVVGLQVEYTDEEKAYLGFLFIMSLWLLEIGNALSNYVVAYVTQTWFFKTGQNCAIAKAYFSGLVYHLGSLAFGSFLIAMCRGARIILSIASEAMKDTGNVVGQAVACCCNCFVTCFQKFLEKINKFAYMDIAINSNNFCTAAGHSLSVLTHDATSVFFLCGATVIFEVVGVGFISASGAAFTYLTCTNMQQYSNPSAETYVEDPVSVAVISAALCFFVALPFMMVFSTVADTVLFCFAVEAQRAAPDEEMMSLVQAMHAPCLLSCLKKLPLSKSLTVGQPDSSRHPAGTKALLEKAEGKK